MNKFEQVSNDDHQMSVGEGGRSPGLMFRGGGRSPGLMGRVLYHVAYPTMHVKYLPTAHVITSGNVSFLSMEFIPQLPTRQFWLIWYFVFQFKLKFLGVVRHINSANM